MIIIMIMVIVIVIVIIVIVIIITYLHLVVTDIILRSCFRALLAQNLLLLSAFRIFTVEFVSLNSGSEKTEHDDDLIFEEFARMRVRGEHFGEATA